MEKARQKFDKTRESLDKKRAYAEEFLRPVLDKTLKAELQWIQVCFEECKLTKPKKKKELFARFILSEIDALFVFAMVFSEEERNMLQQVAKECENIAYSDTLDDDGDSPDFDKMMFDNMMSEMQEMVRDAGLEVDFSELTYDLSPEEMQARAARLLAEAREAAGQKRKKKKLSKKEMEREHLQLQKEEARKKSIGSIYKGLAKVLHPDLEKDPDERLKKEEFMKKLTIAYKENDLYALLQLEQEWMNGSEDRLNALDDDQIKIYIEVFKEQIREIQANESTLVYHRDYAFISCLAEGPFHLKYWKPEENRKELEERRSILEKDMSDMARSAEGRKIIIQEILDQFEEEEKEDEKMMEFVNIFHQ